MLSEQNAAIAGAVWLALNAIFLTLMWVRGRYKIGLANDNWDIALAETDHLRSLIRTGGMVDVRNEGEIKAARAELQGYRHAVKDLTAHPTTVIIDPYRQAARSGEEAPV